MSELTPFYAWLRHNDVPLWFALNAAADGLLSVVAYDSSFFVVTEQAEAWLGANRYKIVKARAAKLPGQVRSAIQLSIPPEPGA